MNVKHLKIIFFNVPNCNFSFETILHAQFVLYLSCIKAVFYYLILLQSCKLPRGESHKESLVHTH